MLTAEEKTEAKTLENALSAAQKKVKGKYKQVLKEKDGEYDKEVHEYVDPSGKAGYVVIMRTEKGGEKYHMSTGFGPEAEARTKPWRLVDSE